MDKNKLICFDVDGTLVEGRSSWATLTAGLGCSVEKINEIYQKTENGEMPFEEGVRYVENMYCQSGQASSGKIKAIFSDIPLKNDALCVVGWLKENGYQIYLVSGGIDIYVKTIADKIGAHGFFGHASLEFDSRGMLAKIHYGKNQANAKVKRVKDLSKDLDVSLSEIVFVGDSKNDLGAFEITRRGIAVYPYDKELEAVAWKKIRLLSEIKNIIDR